MTKQIIFKVQRSGCGRFALIHDKDGDHLRQVRWQDVSRLPCIRGLVPMTKCFVYAIENEKSISITGRAPSQDW